MVSEFVRQFCVKYGLGPSRLVVAASGGVDSTALLLVMADLRADGFEPLAAHVNHHLRDVESDEDEAFVAALARDLDLPFFRADAPLESSAVRHRGIEAAARETRYAALQRIRARSGARYIATAHQRDDQAETVLMRLIGGGGLAALRGIHPVRADGVIRPLLEVPRPAIEAFLHERGIVPRQDRSNAEPRFLRNRVRGLLRELDAAAPLAALADEASRAWSLLDGLVEEAGRVHAERGTESTAFVSLPDDEWLGRALLHREILRLDPLGRDVGAAALARLAAGFGRRGRVSVTGRLELLTGTDGGAVLRRRLPDASPFEAPLAAGAPAVIAEIAASVHLRRVPEGADLSRDPQRQVLQVPAADGRFLVRSRRPGDRFQPLGLGAAKKLKDFLIDRKIPVGERDRLPLVLWNGEIAWVAGVEVSERFKVTGTGGILYEVWTEGVGAGVVGNHPGIHR